MYAKTSTLLRAILNNNDKRTKAKCQLHSIEGARHIINIVEFAECSACAHSEAFSIDNKQPMIPPENDQANVGVNGWVFKIDKQRVIHKDCTDPTKGERCANASNIYPHVCGLVVLGPVVATSA